MTLEAMPIEERRKRSALVIVLPELDEHIDAWRHRYTEDGASTRPHVTLMSPFVAPVETTEEVRCRIGTEVARTPAFSLSIASAARFPAGVLYLRPEPDGPLQELIARLRRAFPEIPTYWDQYDEVIPHITVADAALVDTPETLDAIEAAVTALLPLECRVREAVLMQRVRPAPAPWDVQGRFPLGGSIGEH